MRLGAILFALLLAGCTSGGNPNGDQGSAAGQPSRHDLASNQVLEIPAGQNFANSFSVQGSIPATYAVQFSDGSSADMGFVREQDLAEYQQGQAVTTWAYQSNSLGTSQQVTLPAGSYAFVVHCNNDFLDCDGAYNLYAFY